MLVIVFLVWTCLLTSNEACNKVNQWVALIFKNNLINIYQNKEYKKYLDVKSTLTDNVIEGDILMNPEQEDNGRLNAAINTDTGR